MKKTILVILGLLVIAMGVFTILGIFTSALLWYGIVQIVIGIIIAAQGLMKA